MNQGIGIVLTCPKALLHIEVEEIAQEIRTQAMNLKNIVY
jgi:hypothetical protein